jgi:acetyltransferase-like isoleucine patch superfamily enzyme
MNSLLYRLKKILRRLFRGDPGYKEFIRGQGNVLETKGALLSNVSFDILGDRNRIGIGAGSKIYNLKFHLRGSDQIVEIGPNCRVTRGGVFWLEDDGCKLTVGPDTSMVEVEIAVTEPGSRVTIGSGCMFANDIDIRAGDSHSIIDKASGKRINFAEDVAIGDRVWVAAHSIILKGAQLGEDSVVAAGAVVTGSCQPGSILAGNPAKVVKTGITWNRKRIPRE